jgi:hypothetical protein
LIKERSRYDKDNDEVGRILQSGAVDDLHVDCELATTVIDDKDTDGTTTSLEGLGEATPEIRLVNDRDGLLDITSLGHGNNYDNMLVIGSTRH